MGKRTGQRQQSRLSCRWLLETLKRSMFNIIKGWFGEKLTTFGMCGCNCLNLRESRGSEICPLSTLNDLYDIVRDSDRLVTF